MWLVPLLLREQAVKVKVVPSGHLTLLIPPSPLNVLCNPWLRSRSAYLTPSYCRQKLIHNWCIKVIFLLSKLMKTCTCNLFSDKEMQLKCIKFTQHMSNSMYVSQTCFLCCEYNIKHKILLILDKDFAFIFRIFVKKTIKQDRKTYYATK